MTWQERLQDLAKAKKEEFNKIEEWEKRRVQAVEENSLRVGPVIEKMAIILGGYIEKQSSSEWHLHLKKPDGRNSETYVDIMVDAGWVFMCTSSHSRPTGDAMGTVYMNNEFSPHRSLVAEEKAFEDKLSEVIAECVKAIRS